MNFTMEQWERAMAIRYEQFKPHLVDIPEGVSGPWKVEKFQVKADMQAMRLFFDGRGVPPGQYTRLSSKENPAWMTDTPAEFNDAGGFIFRAGNIKDCNVLISGLGLGMVVKALLRKDTIKSITVIELEADVIKLVAPHYPDPRLRVINADAWEWEPDMKFDIAWHDIWGDISSDDLPEMAAMKRRYQRHMTGPGMQECWGQEILRRDRRRYG